MDIIGIFIPIFFSFLVLVGCIADASATAETDDVMEDLGRESSRISQGWGTLKKLIEVAATSGKLEREDLLLEVEKIVAGGSLDAVAKAIAESAKLVSMDDVMDLAANLSSGISSAINFASDAAGRVDEDAVVKITSLTDEDFDAVAEIWSRSSGSGQDNEEANEDGFTSVLDLELEDLESGAGESEEVLPGWLPDEKGFGDDLTLKAQSTVIKQQTPTSKDFNQSESPSRSSKLVVIVATQVCLFTFILAYVLTSKLIKRSRHGSSIAPTDADMLGGNPRLNFPPTYTSHLVAKQQASGCG